MSWGGMGVAEDREAGEVGWGYGTSSREGADEILGRRQGVAATTKTAGTSLSGNKAAGGIFPGRGGETEVKMGKAGGSKGEEAGLVSRNYTSKGPGAKHLLSKTQSSPPGLQSS